jgi:hypothetical protein
MSQASPATMTMKAIEIAILIRIWAISGGIEVFLEDDEVDFALDFVEVEVHEALALQVLAKLVLGADDVSTAPATGVHPRCSVGRAEELLH